MVVTAEVRSIHHKNHLKKERTVLKKTQSTEMIQLITLISYQRPQMISREKQSTSSGQPPKGKTSIYVKGPRMKMKTTNRESTKTSSSVQRLHPAILPLQFTRAFQNRQVPALKTSRSLEVPP